jgi:hypothetical protein
MPRKQRIVSNKSRRTPGRRRAFRAPHWYRPGLEPLEDRTLLTGYFNQIADTVTGDTGALANITHALQGLNAVVELPILNKKLTDLQDITNSLDSFRQNLDTTLRGLDPTKAAAADIQSAVFAVLGPAGANLLLNKVDLPNQTPGTIGPEDVVVTGGGPNHDDFSSQVDVNVDLGKTVTFGSPVDNTMSAWELIRCRSSRRMEVMGVLLSSLLTRISTSAWTVTAPTSEPMPRMNSSLRFREVSPPRCRQASGF